MRPACRIDFCTSGGRDDRCFAGMSAGGLSCGAGRGGRHPGAAGAHPHERSGAAHGHGDGAGLLHRHGLRGDMALSQERALPFYGGRALCPGQLRLCCARCAGQCPHRCRAAGHDPGGHHRLSGDGLAAAAGRKGSPFWLGWKGRAVIGGATGFMAGLTGAGGPVASIPWMVLVGYSPIHAVALSMPYQIATSFSGSVGNMMGGHVDWMLLPALCAVQVVGLLGGIAMAQRVFAQGHRCPVHRAGGLPLPASGGLFLTEKIPELLLGDNPLESQIKYRCRRNICAGGPGARPLVSCGTGKYAAAYEYRCPFHPPTRGHGTHHAGHALLRGCQLCEPAGQPVAQRGLSHHPGERRPFRR